MRLDRGFLGWGIFFILLGAIPLAVNGGILTTQTVTQLLGLWPLLLVGIGLAIILSRTSLAIVGTLLIAATAGILAGSLASTDAGRFASAVCGPSDDADAIPESSGPFGAAATVDVELDCGDLVITTASGDTWSFSGTGNGADISADEGELRLNDPGGSGAIVDRDRWDLRLPTAPALEVDLSLNAGTADVDMADARMDALSLQLNAGNADLRLGQAEELDEIQVEMNAGSLGVTLPAAAVSGSIDVNAGSVKLCLPGGVAVRLRTGDSFAGSYDYDGHGLVHEGNTWQSPDFGTASVRIDLSTEANAGSIELDPPEGCHD